MAEVVVAPAAVDDLTRLIHTHSLPADTGERVKRSLLPLARFPLLGAQLRGRWDGFRFILGPWRWLVVVYASDEGSDRVSIVTFEDGRSSKAPTAVP